MQVQACVYAHTRTLVHSCVCMCNIFRQLQPFSAFQFNFKTAAIVVASHSSLSLFPPFALSSSSFFALSAALSTVAVAAAASSSPATAVAKVEKSF